MTTTRYAQVAELLRHAVAAADTGPAGALPTEAELCARYGASRTTVRRALLMLRAEGVLLSRQGSGWAVTPRHRGPCAPHYRVRSTAGGRARTLPPPMTETVALRHRAPPPDIAAVLRARRRAPLLLVERITRAGGTVIHRAETWFNHDYSTRLDPSEARAHPPALLLARHGQAFGPFDQYVEAVAANRRDQQLLGVALGRPVLQVVRTAYALDGTALFRSCHRHPGHNTEIEIWLPTSDDPSGSTVTIDGTR